MKSVRNDRLFCLQATYCKDNYGSALQCYSTQRFLKERSIDCFLINKTNSGLTRIVYAFLIRTIRLLKKTKYSEVKEAIKRQSVSSTLSRDSLSKESKEKIDLFVESSIKIINASSLELFRIAHKDNCLYYLTGSDQIWNARRVIPDEIYFAVYAPPRRRVALAASFGSDYIPVYNRKCFKKFLSKYHKLSTREDSGTKIIMELLSRTATHLLDPVFLVKKDDWISFAKSIENININNYYFCYFLDAPHQNAVRDIELLSKSGCLIISIGYRHPDIEHFVEYYDADPREFVRYILQSSCVLTDSFHATSFATILHKPFYVYKRNYKDNDQSVRIVDFLNHVQLSDHYIGEGSMIDLPLATNFEECDRCIRENLNSVVEYLEI